MFLNKNNKLLDSLVEYLIKSDGISLEEAKEIDEFLLEQAKKDLKIIYEDIDILFEAGEHRNMVRNAAKKAKANGHKTYINAAGGEEEIPDLGSSETFKEKISDAKTNTRLKARELKNSAKEKIINDYGRARKFVKAAAEKHPTGAIGAKVAGGVAAVGLGALVYKKYMSKAARVCSGLSGKEKVDCIDRYKQAAIAAKNRKG